MGQISTNDLKQGMKLEIERDPYLVVSCEFVKPGKGQAFTRTKLKNLLTNRVIERTYKSGEKFEIADVVESTMRLLYTDTSDASFMDDNTYEQISIPLEAVGDQKTWLLDDQLYDIVFYKGAAINVIPPTFMELEVTETAPGVRGDTASGRVMKPCTLETGAEIQVPIFIEQGEKIKVDTRNGSYVSRV